MKVLGLDIGTTTVSAVVVENGKVLQSLTRANTSFYDNSAPWEKLQDPEHIKKIAFGSIEELFTRFPDIERIGITGQMHGIVYLNASGESVSPFYIWQDGRGDLPLDDGRSYAKYLTESTGYPMATGFGLTTHFYNLRNGLAPNDAVVFCTIHDYVAMSLCGRTSPVTDVSDAASLGLFDVKKGCFDMQQIRALGMDCSMLPKLAHTPCLGSYRGCPVYVGIGDNQASFIGAAGGQFDCIVVNVGTGSQISAYSEKYIRCKGLETRPFPGGGYLLVGAPLCGGRAFALLENFFRKAADMLGCPTDSAYGAMDALLASSEKPADLPVTVPLFQGTRANPTLRGTIKNLSTENFTPLALIWSMMEGMARELYDLYCAYRSTCGEKTRLIGSGNGLRKNVFLQDCISSLFGQPLIMSQCTEEAASGAAMFAAMN